MDNPHIKIGHPMIGEVIEVPIGTTITFIDQNGRNVLEVHAKHVDGEPLELNVRGCDTTKIGNTIYSNLISVLPESSNSINVINRVYKIVKNELDKDIKFNK